MGDEATTDAVAEQITRDGQHIAEKTMERACGSSYVAIAMLGVAVASVLGRLDQNLRRELLRDFLDAFDEPC